MFKTNSFACTAQILALVLVAGTVAGCASKQEQALDQAKAQAAKTGQAQQVISVDKNGNTTTTVVQPPANGQNQNSEAIATTVTPPTAGVATPAASGPMVSVAPPPPPVEVNIVAGTPLTIRIDQWISVKHSRAGDTFTGEIVDPVLANDNSALIPKGALVDGVVDVSHRRGHFRGRSLLRDLAETKKGKGRRSSALISGGTGVGMVVGGVATGGVGLVVGGLVGGGVGTAVAGLTGNRDLDIPAESIVRFRLADDLVVDLAQPCGPGSGPCPNPPQSLAVKGG